MGRLRARPARCACKKQRIDWGSLNSTPSARGQPSETTMATYTPGIAPRGFDSGVTAEEVEVWKASEAQRKKNAEIEGTAATPSAANDDQLPNPLKTTHEVDQYHDEQRVRDAEINDALKEIASGAPSK